MAAAACNPGEAYPLVVKHPWRPHAYVVGDGVHGSVQIATVTGEVARLHNPGLLGARAFAVNPRIMGWRSEESIVACGGPAGIALTRISPDATKNRIEARTGGGDDAWTCSSLQWNPVHPNTQLAATFYARGVGVATATGNGSTTEPYVRVYDVQGAGPMSTVKEYRGSSAAAGSGIATEGYSLCWTEPTVLLASTSDGLARQDLRQQVPDIALRGIATPLVHLARSPADQWLVVGVEVGAAWEPSRIKVFDMRQLGQGAAAMGQSRLHVTSLVWRDDSSWFLTSSRGASVVEVWDPRDLESPDATALTLDRYDDVGTVGGGGGGGVDDGATAVETPIHPLPLSLRRGAPHPSTSGREEHSVGCAVGCAAWAGDAPASYSHTMKPSHFDANAAEHPVNSSTVSTSPGAFSEGPAERPILDLVLLTERGELCSNQAIGRRKLAMARAGVVVLPSGDATTDTVEGDAGVPVVAETLGYHDDVSVAMQHREAVGFGVSRHGSYAAAMKFQDPGLLHWSHTTWLMRRVFDHNPAIGAYPSVVALLKRDDLHMDLLKESEEERKEAQKAKGNAVVAALEAEVAALEDARSVACEPPEDLPCTGHHAVLQKQFRTYESPAREVVKALCGWADGVLPVRPTLLHGAIGDAATRFEVHVAYKILNLQLSEAEHMLRGSPAYFRCAADNTRSSTYSLLAFAISALTLDASIGWKDTITSLSNTGLSVYLTSALQFLSCWRQGAPAAAGEPWAMYRPILECLDLDPLHRVGFACIYLNDAALAQYLTHIMAEPLHPMTRLLLAGVSDTTLADYLDDTGDIQLTAFTAVLFLKPNADSTQRWTRHFREFLSGISDFARCRTEIVLAGLRKKEGTTTVPAPFASGFGGGAGVGMQSYNAMMYRGMHRRGGLDPKKLATRVQKSMSLQHGPGGLGGPPGGAGSREAEKKNDPKLQVICQDCRTKISYDPQRSATGGAAVCPYCSAPAPKCSVCVQVLGNDLSFPVPNFTWCLTCQHGGHVDHLAEWFAEHEVCPVAGCNCPCASLDAVP